MTRDRSEPKPRRTWPAPLRRGPMENVATALIGMGFLMMFQPFALLLYTWSLVALLLGTLMFIIVSKFPD